MYHALALIVLLALLGLKGNAEENYTTTISFDARGNSYKVRINGNVAVLNLCLVHYMAQSFQHHPVDGIRPVLLPPPVIPRMSRTIQSSFSGFADFTATVECMPMITAGSHSK